MDHQSREKAVDQPVAERNLLFGILALQNGFIDRRQLVRAFDDWVSDKSQRFGEVLLKDGAITANELELIAALVDRHIARHGGDPQQSLAAVRSLDSLPDEFSQTADADVRATLSLLPRSQGVGDPPSTIALGIPTSKGARFQILRRHAKGGLGEVFVAEDSELNRQVALKQIQDRFADEPDARARFLLEAQVTGALEHPGIVPVYGLGTHADGRPYYAMRLIKGESLQAAVDRVHAGTAPDVLFSSLKFRRLLNRFIDVCEAVEYAHSRGVLHRDLKPGNIMLGKYGETLVVDWGLAKVKGRAERSRVEGETTLRPASATGSALTQMGAAHGTPAYMSPEQAGGRLDELGPASDVYSLGATLYYVLTGAAPFNNDELNTTLRKVESSLFLRPRAVNRRIPKALEAICLKSMALRPKHRYESPQAIVEDIEAWLATAPPMRAVGVLFCLFIAGILGLVSLIYQSHRNSSRMYEEMVLQGATVQMRMIRELRSLYSSEVVDRALPHGIEVAHDYQTRDRAIPLPATLTMLLGERLQPGAHVRLRSNYPFPWRSEDEARIDQFERDALAALEHAPTKSFSRFEDYKGRPSLRLAVADVMEESCVACHNQHPDSPKTDWQVGEVRGILEVIRPLEVGAATTAAFEARLSFALMLGLCVALAGTGVIGLVVILRRQWQMSQMRDSLKRTRGEPNE